jgi:LuxR family maltose regulon positive regulatory protein
MSTVLLKTKLHVPAARPEWVPRPHLIARLNEGLSRKLILIAAPPGYGKTTLVSSWATSCGRPVAWLSLDKNDNQIGRFLGYLLAALQEVDQTIGSDAAQLVTAGQAPPETVLTSLINDLDTTRGEITLVLDDYQFIRNQAIHDAVAFLLEHCPPALHLLIASRSDPPLPVARLRARGQMIEMRVADLRFTESEIAQFLNEVMGLRLDAKSITVLEERTEGWIAGLQMAALSMRDRKDVHRFIEGFSGTSRYILDYLLEEVLASQPPEIQRFLLHTSILERLTAPLCDAVFVNDEGAKEGSADRLPGSAALFANQSGDILEYLERANLFLVPLDDDRRWYRYHHLFADLLRARLAHSPYARYQKSLHALASNWYEMNGFTEEAIPHALAAEDYPGAARQVEAAAENAWLNGQYASILAWINALPIQLVHSRPWLCIWTAWVYTQMGIPQDILQWIETAEQSAGNENQDAQALLNEIATLKAFAVYFSRDYHAAIGLAENVLKGPPLKHKKAAHFIRCNILHVLSSMYFATGQLLRAEQICRETMELANRIGFTLRYLHAVNKLVLIYQITGRLVSADQILEESQSTLQEQDSSHYFATIQLRFRKIELLYERNRLAEAQRLIDLILEQNILVDVPYLLVDFYNLQAYSLLTKQDYTGAQNILNKAIALARQTYIWEGLTWRTEWLQIRLWLQKGDIAAAARWTSERAEDSSAVITFSNEVWTVARARILLAQGARREGIFLLDRLSHASDADGRDGSLIEIRALKALALHGEGEVDQSAAEIESALALAEPEGYVRTLIDEGRPMQLLLAQWVARASAGPLRDYAVRLLSHFDAEPQPITVLQEQDASTGNLLEPLSQRELEVLHLIALGKTNQEIARQLFISPGTVKAHTASIYRKVDVANRTEAVARARQLGILVNSPNSSTTKPCK